MSKFKTCIPVNVGAVLALLPPKAFLHGHKFNPETNAVEIEWEHDGLKTPYSFPVDFPLADLEAKQIPKGIAVVNGGTAPQNPVASPVEKPEVVAQDETTAGATTSDPGETPESGRAKRAKRAAAPGGVGA